MKMVVSLTTRKALQALAEAGCGGTVRIDPPPPAPTGENAFSTYTWDHTNRGTDPYWQAAQAALSQIANHPHLPGAMEWARRFSPALHAAVTETLPLDWEQLWDQAAPLAEFQQVLDRWVRAHLELTAQYPVDKGCGK